MDIRSYFGSTSQASSDGKADSDSEDHGTDSSDPESSPSPPPLMELQLFLDEGPVFRHVSRNTLLMLCLYTANVIYCSWLVFNLPIKLLALLMFTEH